MILTTAGLVNVAVELIKTLTNLSGQRQILSSLRAYNVSKLLVWLVTNQTRINKEEEARIKDTRCRRNKAYFGASHFRSIFSLYLN